MADLNRNASIIALRKGGIGPREIARRMKVTPGLVAGVLHRAGMCEENGTGGRGGNNRVPDAYRRLVLKDLAAGSSFSAVSARWDVGVTTIQNWRREARASQS